MSKWAEIRCDYYNSEEKWWAVDAWETSNDNEEGKVIAHIDAITGRVIYNDPLARVDDYAQSVITETTEDIKNDFGVNLFDFIHNALQERGADFCETAVGDRIRTFANEIQSKDEAVVEAIADLFKALDYDDVSTGYYDPEEDRRNNEVDGCTGWYYVR